VASSVEIVLTKPTRRVASHPRQSREIKGDQGRSREIKGDRTDEADEEGREPYAASISMALTSGFTFTPRPPLLGGRLLFGAAAAAAALAAAPPRYPPRYRASRSTNAVRVSGGT
jgi:hypothetical protein